MRDIYGEKRVLFVPCDVTDQDQFIKLFDECEKYFKVKCVDLLVNNAGINTNFGWKKCMEVNIMGVMNGTEIAMERMKKAPKRGTIINTASMAGIVTGYAAEGLPYFVSKHGVVSLTRTLNASYGETGVSVKALCSSWTETEIVTGVREDIKADVDARVKTFGGLMTVEHVADAFFSLLTECPSGSVMAVLKGVPFFLIPDTSEMMIKALALLSILINKIKERSVIQVHDLKKGLAATF